MMGRAAGTSVIEALAGRAQQSDAGAPESRRRGQRGMRLARGLVVWCVAVTGLVALAPAARASGTYGPGDARWAAYYYSPNDTSTWSAFCQGAGGAWKATVAGVPACGPTGSTTIDFPGSSDSSPGFQCVELVKRYFQVTRGWVALSGSWGGNIVARYGAAHGVPVVANIGSERTPPAAGTVISFADNSAFSAGGNDSGHTAIVSAVDPSVASSGTGNITIVSQNYLTSGGGDVHTDTLQMSGWVIHPYFSGLPYMEWLNPGSPMLIRQGSTVSAKQGLGDQWTTEMSGASTSGVMRVAHNRLAVWDSSQSLYAADGFTGTWHLLATNVGAYSVSDQIVVIRQGSTILAKSGLTDGWTTEMTGVPTSDIVKAAGDRIAVWDTVGHGLWAKEGLNGSWYYLAGGVDSWDITPQVVIVRQGSTVSAKAQLGDGWTTQMSGASTTGVVKADGSRMADWDGSHSLYAADNLASGWHLLANNVDSYGLSSSLVAIRQGSTISAKAGLTDVWTTQMTGASTTGIVRVDGERMAVWDNSQSLYAADGLHGSWTLVATNVGSWDI